MLLIGPTNYKNFLIDNKTSKVILHDHLGGFDQHLHSQVLDRLIGLIGNKKIEIETEYIVDPIIKSNYSNLDFVYNNSIWHDNNSVDSFRKYTVHPDLNYKTFICSFNGSPHVGRKLLVSILNRFGYFDPDTCSKNFVYTTDILQGHIKDLAHDEERIYSKFFISIDNGDFFSSIYSFGHDRFNHAQNIYKLESKLTQSFLHLVSETMATSYYPFVTEKFLYSVVTRGLFLAYAQPGWHDYLERYYGFRKYNRIFDYRFDNIKNPVERLVELMTMISKFSVLSTDDWQDLYLIQKDEIEYNYNHYFSGNYLTHLKQYA